MRYYTKEWYELMQKVGLSGDFIKIPDAEYKSGDIKKLYDKALSKEIEKDRKAYDTEPCFLSEEEMFPGGEFDPESCIIIDEDTGDVKIPKTKEEAMAQIEYERCAAMEKFKSRPPFDPSETVSVFSEIYKNSLKVCRHNYPKWMTDSVDKRLIVLGYLPESAYNRYKAEEKANRALFCKINKAAEKELSKQDVSEDIENALSLHDASLLSIKKSKASIVMTVRKDGLWPDDETPYRRIVFKNAEVTERDEGLRARKYISDGYYPSVPERYYYSNVSFLYKEIYRKNEKYEAHMMFFKYPSLLYLTVVCDDIRYTDGISL